MSVVKGAKSTDSHPHQRHFHLIGKPCNLVPWTQLVRNSATTSDLSGSGDFLFYQPNDTDRNEQRMED